MTAVRWAGKLRNEELLRRIVEEWALLGKFRKRKINSLGRYTRGDCLTTNATIKETIGGRNMEVSS